MQPLYGTHSFDAVQRFVEEHVHPLSENLREIKRIATHPVMVANSLKRDKVAVHRLPKTLRAYTAGNSVIGGAKGRVSSLVSYQALEASDMKSVGLSYFTAQDLPTIAHRSFGPEDTSALAYAMGLGTSVIKPDVGRPEQGLTLGVRDAAEFQTAWEVATKSASATAHLSNRILVEPLLDILTLRCYVVGHQLIAATVMVPLFVVGDGEHSIAQLVEEDWQLRQKHRMLRALLPEISGELLETAVVNTDAVPAAGEIQVLSAHTTLPTGALPVNVHTWMHEDLRALALDAFTAIPGTGAAAVTIMTPQLDSADGAVLLDLDARASAQPHRYPAIGRPGKGGLATAEQLRLRGKYWKSHSSVRRGQESALLD